MKRLRPIMFVGTGSDVGKSAINAGFCRVFKQDGYAPAPFKAQNMSLNSYATPDGFEIGRAQAAQAEACGIACRTEMNPILLKPTKDNSSQVILNGKPYGNMSSREYFNSSARNQLFSEVMQSYERLSNEYSPIVIEGAGSISELNLKEQDIVNMRIAVATGAATYLVADIDRGGIFASVYGSIALLTDEERDAIKGIIINKFRGDITLFDEGRKILEEITGKPVVGVMPHIPNLYIEGEDSVAMEHSMNHAVAGKVNIAVIKLRHLSNYTDFDMLSSIDEINLYYADRAEQLADADLIIIPGSKNTIGDLKVIRDNGVEAAIKQHHEAGKPLYGICGGYQMMGQQVLDPDGVEGEEEAIEGIGLLPIVTTLTQDKKTEQCRFAFIDGSAEGVGYEIHAGITQSDQPLALLNGGTNDGYYANRRLWGSYIHGIFDNRSVIEQVVREVKTDFAIELDHKSRKEAGYDLLAETIREVMDMDYIYQSMAI